MKNNTGHAGRNETGQAGQSGHLPPEQNGTSPKGDVPFVPTGTTTRQRRAKVDAVPGLIQLELPFPAVELIGK